MKPPMPNSPRPSTRPGSSPSRWGSQLPPSDGAAALRVSGALQPTTPAVAPAAAANSKTAFQRFAETSTRGAVGAVGAVVLMHRGHGLYGLGYWLLRAARGPWAGLAGSRTRRA